MKYYHDKYDRTRTLPPFSQRQGVRPFPRAIEWTPWWGLTIDRWHTEGLPADCKSTGDIQGFFGLDRCLQSGASYRTKDTPYASAHGLGVMEDEEDWERIRKTLFPPVETVMSEEHFAWLEETRQLPNPYNQNIFHTNRIME